MMADLILVYQTGQMSYKKLKEVIDETDDLEPDGSHYLEQIDLVQFKDYSFSYPGAERKSLSGIDWTIQKGQTVGIVGRTGAGKTTLVRQFLRQYPVGEGEFLVNQQPIVATTDTPSKKKLAMFPKNIFYFPSLSVKI